MKRAAIGLFLGAIVLPACGSGPESGTTHHRGFGAPANGGHAAPAPKAAVGSAPGTAKGAPTALPPNVIPPSLRPKLTDEDFSEDPSGDVVRDPFHSFLLHSAAPVVVGTSAGARPTHTILMAKYHLEDLKLAGIIREGSVYAALFIAPDGVGYTVHRTDYISSSDAYVDLIDDLGVVLKIGGGPAAQQLSQPANATAEPTGAPQVATVRISLHPEDLTPTSTTP